ncbi:hypothetical protein MATL_G00138110 [Megalops atlanticus]|uniref:Ig-like domain-containing protein n=1 Tax=Megalops atlanticus TaxID=7932 RepID=A0A9D3T996_MEGAT|nr:hypothetical protein MATL_G00138110 [Megalops atlanticus]
MCLSVHVITVLLLHLPTFLIDATTISQDKAAMLKIGEDVKIKCEQGGSDQQMYWILCVKFLSEKMLTFFMLTALLPLTASQTIQQSPSDIVQKAGSSARLNCTVQGFSEPYMYWYRQSPEGLLEMIFQSMASRTISVSPVKEFTPQRPDSENFYLEAASLTVKHSAVYFCAWSIHVV